MADFDLNLDDLNDSQSITAMVKNAYYPENQQIVNGTTHSQNDDVGRSLMSRDIMKVMQGDGIYRNPAFPIAGYEHFTKSSLHTVIAMGSDIQGDSVQIADPDDPENFLTGSQARLEIAKNSMLTTGFAPGGFESSMNAFIQPDYDNPQDLGGGGSVSDPSDSGSSGPVDDPNGIPSQTKGYTPTDSAQVWNNGNRAVAFEDELTPQEKEAYAKLCDALAIKKNFKSKNNNGIKNGILINLTENEKGQILKDLNFPLYQSGSYMLVGDKYSYANEQIPKAWLGTGSRRAYMSAALLELFNRLTDSIIVRGAFNGRGILSGNYTPLTKERSFVTDHAFGRGFDIYAVGLPEGEKYNFDIESNAGRSQQRYLDGLNLLLQYISALPQSLHPDQIGISSKLSDELGVVSGLEGANSAVRKMHPNLAPWVNLAEDKSNRHDNHIHISFGAKRAGAILPRQRSTSSPATGGETPATTTPIPGVDDLPENLVTKLTQTYWIDTPPYGKGRLNENEVYVLLNKFGNFSPEVSAIFTAITERESSFIPWTLNYYGYWGLFQDRTMIDGAQNGGAGDAFFAEVPSRKLVRKWQLLFKDWQTLGVTKENIKDFNRRLRKGDPNAGRQYFDPIGFIPVNQVKALRRRFVGKDNEALINWLGKTNDTNILHPWGEKFLYFGWLSGVEFRIAKQVYERYTGKNVEILKDWIRDNLYSRSRARNNDIETGKTLLESWFDGKVYPVRYMSGSGAPDGWPERPTPY